MARNAQHGKRRTAFQIVFWAAVAAAVPLEVGRLIVLGLFTVMWLTMVVIYRMDPAIGRSVGLRPYIVFVGLGLILLVLLLLFEG